MAKFVPLISGLIVTAMFAFSLLTGGVIMQLQNNASVSNSITNDSDLYNFYQSVNNSLLSSYKNTSIENSVFSNSSIVATGTNPYISSLGGIWKVVQAAPVGIYNLVVNYAFGKLLGADAAFVLTSALAGIIMLVSISAVVYLLSRGEGG